MPTEPPWLSPREDRAWRAYLHAHHQLNLTLNRHLLQDSGLTDADYEILAVLSGHPTGHLPAQELGAVVQWEKSRLSHQVRRMQERGLLAREPNPADGRSALICLLPAGRRAIEAAAPQHVRNVRRHFTDLFTPAELDTLTTLSERVLRHLTEEPLPEEPGPRQDNETIRLLRRSASLGQGRHGRRVQRGPGRAGHRRPRGHCTVNFPTCANDSY